jgi:hypothetical protein
MKDKKPDIVKRLLDSIKQCRAIDRSELLLEAANEIKKLRKKK